MNQYLIPGLKIIQFSILFFKKSLEDNKANLRSTDLFYNVRDNVILFMSDKGLSQTPQILPLPRSGHEGGDFVFIPTN